MNSSQLLQQAKEIIANLKERKEKEESSIKKLNNHLLENTAKTESQYCIGSDNLHKYELKETNKYEDVRNIINNLREKKVQKLNDVTSVNKIIGNLAEPNTCNTSNSTDSCMKKVTENVLNDSGEIVSKASVNYLKKSDNKRFKLKHSSSKQLHLTEFYNVVKSVGNNDVNSEYANEFQSKRIIANSMNTAAKSENQVEKSQLQLKSSILNNTTDFNENKTVYTTVTKKKDHVPHLRKSYSKSKEKGVWDLFNSVKKNNVGQLVAKANTNIEKVATQKLKQADRVNIHKERRLKETVSKNSSKSTIDVCNNITNNKLQDCRLNILNYSSSKENIFVKSEVKSFSTGNTISKKENHNYTNSVPLTNYELTNVKKRLEGNITFDDFFESVLKSINSKNDDKFKTDVIELDDIHNEEKNGYNKMKMYKSKETILSILSKQSDCNKEIQVEEKSHYSDYDKEKCYNFELDTAVNLIDENMDLSYQNNYHEFNQSSEDHKNLEKQNSKTISQDIDTYWSQYIYQCTDGERSKCTSQINQPDLILENGNGIMKDKRSTVEEENCTEDFYHCVGNCSKNEANVENCLESQINLLDNDLEKSILTAAYRKNKTREKTEENAEPFNLENFLENVILNNEKKTTAPYKCNLKIKRYRKGKTKIFKLKRLKKRFTETEERNEDLNLPDLLKKIATGNLESQPQFSRFKSGSSISTSSSYAADDTKSDVLSTGSRELTSPQQRLRIGFNELSKDDSLLYSANEWEDISEHDREDIKIKIQDLFFKILEDFKNKRSSYFRHRRQSFDNCIFKDGRLQFKPTTESSMTVISSRAQKSKAKFQLMLHILKKIQTLLDTGTKLTKRELYYQLKESISDQRATDRSINTISCLLNVGMWALNIIAQKGLVFGDLKLLLSSGEMLNCNVPGTLIPRDINDIAEVHSTAYFILVVEKESIFHKLIEEDLPNKLTRPFIMITGKGFPDLNTQLFLRKLWMVMSIPVFILVDADPHGINIMLNYRFGSVNNAHVSQHLAVPNAKWLGVYPSEITNLNIAREPLNEREIKLVNRMLATPYMEFSPKLVDELRVFLTKKFKAGIEGLMKTDSYLSEVYLPNKFFTHNFI